MDLKFKEENLWRSAQEGNLERVKYWVEEAWKKVDSKDEGTIFVL